MSRIKTELSGVSILEENDWEKLNQFFIENLPKFEIAFKAQLSKIK